MARAKARVFSDGSLTKKASLNSIAQALDYGARAIAGLVVNPILLRYLGDAGFGNWQVLLRLIGHTGPAGGRPAEALKWFVANRQSSTDLQGKSGGYGYSVRFPLTEFAPGLHVIRVQGRTLAGGADAPIGRDVLIRIR